MRSSCTGRRRSPTSRCSGSSPGRVLAPTSPRAVSSSSHCAQAWRRADPVPWKQQVRRRAPRRGRGRGNRGHRCARRSCAGESGRRSHRARPPRSGHRRGDAPCGPDRPCGIEVRARRRRRPRGGQGCARLGARRRRAPRAHRLAADPKRRKPARGRAACQCRGALPGGAGLDAARLRPRRRPRCSSFAGTRPSRGKRSSHGSCSHVCVRTGPSRRVRSSNRAARSSARPGSRSTGSASSSARQAWRLRRSTAACPTIRARSSTDRATRHSLRTVPTRNRWRVPHRRQALRVR